MAWVAEPSRQLLSQVGIGGFRLDLLPEDHNPRITNVHIIREIVTTPVKAPAMSDALLTSIDNRLGRLTDVVAVMHDACGTGKLNRSGKPLYGLPPDHPRVKPGRGVASRRGSARHRDRER